MDPVRSELVLLLAGIAAIVFIWLWLLTGKKHSSIPLNSAHKSLAFRISSIPREVNKELLQDILTRLPTTAGGAASQHKYTLLGFSYSPSAAPSHAERYAVATATFAIAPTTSELEKSIKREIGINASRLKVDLDFFGLTPLADPLQDTAVDIIAVTGLAGHAFGSWKSKQKSDMWLRDFLPEAVPNARILTYGYDTKLPGSQSEASIPDLSRRLLESIKTIRSGHTKTRPLILIGHSLGGLVVKEALAEASEGSEDDRAVFRSCYAVMFFAVPNRGLDNSSLMAMVKGQPNEDLVKDLKQSSRFLSMLHQRFNNYFILDDSKIICVYETRKTPTVQWCLETASWEKTGSEVMMVPYTSAIHAGPNEKAYDQIPIDTDHSEIVKFSDTSNPDYLIIESRIRELVAKAPKVIEERFAKLKRELSDSEKRFIEAMKAPDYAAFRNNKVDSPTPGTLGWFLANELVDSWLTTYDSSALWVQGSPGQGKTILTKFLLAHLESFSSKSRHRTTVIYFFFYNQDDNYQTISAALRSLIKQLLLVPDAFQIISEKFDLDGSTLTEESMWAILEELLHSSIFDTVYCVIDALDECQDFEARQRLSEFIKKLVQPPLAREREKVTTLKAFLTSRPAVDLSRSLKQFPSIHLKANPNDLKKFILGKIHTIGLPAELECRAIDLLSSRVEQTFLWISIILKKLKTVTTLLSEADMEQIINESPSDLTDLYESIISQIMRSNDVATQKLLIWTVFGRRALTLHELKDALAIQENSKSTDSIRKFRIQDLTESKITSAAGIILEIIGGKVYLIHQSAKDFLLRSEHLAKAVFCQGLRPGIYLAKTCMTYLCFTDFVETGPCRDSAQLEERIRRHPFFYYAARNWHRHIRIDDNINDFASVISQLTKPGSPGLLAWGEAAGIANLDKAGNAWDVATIANIPWLAEFHSRGNVITKDMIVKAASRGFAGYNFIKTLTEKASVQLTEGAVYAAAKYFDHTTIRRLLDKDASVIITPAIMEAAATNSKYGRLVMDMLLEFQDGFMVTAKLVRLAAENLESGRDIIEMLLLKENTNISEGAVTEIATRFGIEIMRIMLDSREDIKITETVIEAMMARRKYVSYEMIKFLLEQRGQEFQITDNIFRSIAQEFDQEIIELVLGKQDQKLQITEEFVLAMAKRRTVGKEKMILLLDRRGDQITITKEAVITIVERFDKKVITLLLDRRGDQITITEEVVKAAAGNMYSNEVMKLLLDRRGDQITITKEAVITIVERFDKEVITLLLDRRGDQITITKEAVITIVERFDKKVITLLLDRRGDQITITEEVVKAAAGNMYSNEVMKLLLDRRDHITITKEAVITIVERFNGEVITLLFDRRGDQITITEEVIKAAAGKMYSNEVMKLLLDRRGDQITITKEAVIIIAKRFNGEVIKLLLDRWGDQITIPKEAVITIAERFNKEVITLLLDRRGDQITITEEVIKAAAGNNEQVMKLLLDRRGDQITITEEVIKAAARNAYGSKMMKLLFDQRGDQIIITEGIIKVAAGNNYSSGIMALLLDRRGDQIIITEGIVKAAAGNIYDSKVMALLLDRRGDQITITEEVVKAAARNKYGIEVMQLLLDWRGDQITITEEVIKAAARNAFGSKMMKLLFDQRGDQIIITEGIVKAAAGNIYDSKVMALLLDRRGDQITITEEVIKAAAGNNEQVMKLLLDRRGDQITITEEVIKAAATCGQDQILNLLSVQNARTGNVRYIKELISKVTNPDMKNNKGQTPLWVASANGYEAVVKVLAQRADVDVNSMSIDGRSPLFLPSYYGRERIVAILMEAGADPSVVDKYGNTAMMLARRNRYEIVAKILEGGNKTR